MKGLAMLCVWAVCQLVTPVAAAWMLAAILSGSDRAWRIALGYDRLANATTGGMDTETISSRAHRARSEGRRWGCLLCSLLDRIDKDHCRRSAGV